VTASTFIFVRHAESEGVHERLAGRTPGIGLTPRGREQAKSTAEYLARFRIDRIVTSPQQRTRETAVILAESLHVPVEPHDDFDELDFGVWAGLTFSDLDEKPEWKTFNSLRSLTAAPGGESLSDAQTRSIRALLELHSSSKGSCSVVVTHADVIRSLVAFLSGTPLDLFLRFIIDPASVSIIHLSDMAVQIRCLNRTG